MKRQGIFSGIILLGIGLFYLIPQLHMSVLEPFLTWPTILVLIGVAFLLEQNSKDASFSGVLLLGLGIHFYAVKNVAGWPGGIEMMILIISLAFLYQYKNTKDGLVAGIVLLIVSGATLLFHSHSFPEVWYSTITQFRPYVLLVLGAYYVFIRKK
ncbi:DUF5668 domain-containing protein [Fictibacillus sp. Mic-4]|uniref:LiaF transmembrane domain-containing protein n=1 Tax=Fictibacillus TaxID=1329200 RepID=UPI000423F363|nr:DUF5668 domain-containing protein [Fictibacillus gelatini]